MNVANKTVLITGANRGIGRALLEEALARGAKRVYAGTREPLHHQDSRVIALPLDVTNASQIERAASHVEVMDILVNNAGIALYDNLTDPETVERQFAVNVMGPLKMSNAFLPQLKRSRGAIVNNLSLAAIAALPVVPGYSLSKAASSNMAQSLRALLAGHGVTVHSVFLGPIDTDMNRGMDIAKSPATLAASGIFDGLERGEDDIFPDPASRQAADGWRNGIAKGMEREFAAYVPVGV